MTPFCLQRYWMWLQLLVVGFFLFFFNNWNTPLCALCQACHLFSSSGSGLHNFFFCLFYLFSYNFCLYIVVYTSSNGNTATKLQKIFGESHLVAIIVRADWNHAKDFTILTFFLPYYDQAVEMVKVKLFHV